MAKAGNGNYHSITFEEVDRVTSSPTTVLEVVVVAIGRDVTAA